MMHIVAWELEDILLVIRNYNCRWVIYWAAGEAEAD